MKKMQVDDFPHFTQAQRLEAARRLVSAGVIEHIGQYLQADFETRLESIVRSVEPFDVFLERGRRFQYVGAAQETRTLLIVDVGVALGQDDLVEHWVSCQITVEGQVGVKQFYTTPRELYGVLAHNKAVSVWDEGGNDEG